MVYPYIRFNSEGGRIIYLQLIRVLPRFTRIVRLLPGMRKCTDDRKKKSAVLWLEPTSPKRCRGGAWDGTAVLLKELQRALRS